MCQSKFKMLANNKWRLKNGQSVLTLCQSGEIFLNLVTLPSSQIWVEGFKNKSFADFSGNLRDRRHKKSTKNWKYFSLDLNLAPLANPFFVERVLNPPNHHDWTELERGGRRRVRRLLGLRRPPNGWGSKQHRTQNERSWPRTQRNRTAARCPQWN